MGTPDQPLTDEDRERAGAIFVRYQRMIRRIAFRVMRDEIEAEEVVADVAVYLCRRIRTIRDDPGLGGWIYRTTMSRAIDRRQALRQQQAAVNPEADPSQVEDDRPDQESLLIRAQRRRIMADAVAALPAHHRQIMQRRYGFGRFARGHGDAPFDTLRQIADDIGISHGAAMKGAFEARAILTESLKKSNEP